MTAPAPLEMNYQQDAEEWSRDTIKAFEEADKSPKKLVTRAARRVMAKGFEVTHICQVFDVTKPFAWGRSSEGKERTVQWNIQFFEPGGSQEYLLIVRLYHNVSVVKRNPYDRKAPSTEPVVMMHPKDRETSKALGLPLGETKVGA